MLLIIRYAPDRLRIPHTRPPATRRSLRSLGNSIYEACPVMAWHSQKSQRVLGGKVCSLCTMGYNKINSKSPLKINSKLPLKINSNLPLKINSTLSLKINSALSLKINSNSLLKINSKLPLRIPNTTRKLIPGSYSKLLNQLQK